VLGIDLVHGWLLDPDNSDAYAIIHNKSYNQLIDLIIRGNDAQELAQRLEKEMYELDQMIKSVEEKQVTEDEPVTEKDELKEEEPVTVEEEQVTEEKPVTEKDELKEDEHVTVEDKQLTEEKPVAEKGSLIEEEPVTEKESPKEEEPVTEKDSVKAKKHFNYDEPFIEVEPTLEESLKEEPTLEESLKEEPTLEESLKEEPVKEVQPLLEISLQKESSTKEPVRLESNNEESHKHEFSNEELFQDNDIVEVKETNIETESIYTETVEQKPEGNELPVVILVDQDVTEEWVEVLNDEKGQEAKDKILWDTNEGSAHPEVSTQVPQPEINKQSKSLAESEAIQGKSENDIVPTVTPVCAICPEFNDQSHEFLQRMEELRRQIDEAHHFSAVGHTISNFLYDTGHQLTMFGLEQLQKHISEDSLSVFFRNNHFSTITKHQGELYLLVTDLGYANVEEVVWEKLDSIDGNTDYVNHQFKKPPPRTVLAPTAPALDPERVLGQAGQHEMDYQLALRLSEGRAIEDAALDEEEAALIAAATAASLQEHAGPSSPPEDADRQLALQLQAQMDEERLHGAHSNMMNSEDASLALARQLQAEEDARQRQRVAATTAPKPSPVQSSDDKDGSCILS